MRNEGIWLCVFLALAILSVCILSNRERFEPNDELTRLDKLETDMKMIDSRTKKVEIELAEQNAEIAKAESAVDNAVTDFQMISA
jgi:hypothetical protein